ncbi:MAG: Trm112 family protein [Gemmatimonadota bacterium]
MLLELSEVLACPRCGPPQVMVAVVHESVGYRVTSGFLGCPTCDSRFPIEEGTVDFQPQEPLEQPEASAVSPVSPADESAMLIGAVLGLAQGSGHLLLGPELSEAADAVAALAERWEVVSLNSARPAHAARSTNVSRIVVWGGESPPVLPSRFGAAALAGDPAPERVGQFAGALRSLGRLAIVAPGPGAVRAMQEAGLEVIAVDERVAVASRRS